MKVYYDDDLGGGQRSSEIKVSKLQAMAIKRGQKKSLINVDHDDDLDGGQRSPEVKYSKL